MDSASRSGRAGCVAREATFFTAATAAIWSSFFDRRDSSRLSSFTWAWLATPTASTARVWMPSRRLRSSELTCVALRPSSFTLGFSSSAVRVDLAQELLHLARRAPAASLQGAEHLLRLVLQPLEALLRALELLLHERLQVPRSCRVVAMCRLSPE